MLSLSVYDVQPSLNKVPKRYEFSRRTDIDLVTLIVFCNSFEKTYNFLMMGQVVSSASTVIPTSDGVEKQQSETRRGIVLTCKVTNTVVV